MLSIHFIIGLPFVRINLTSSSVLPQFLHPSSELSIPAQTGLPHFKSNVSIHKSLTISAICLFSIVTRFIYLHSIISVVSTVSPPSFLEFILLLHIPQSLLITCMLWLPGLPFRRMSQPFLAWQSLSVTPVSPRDAPTLSWYHYRIVFKQ